MTDLVNSLFEGGGAVMIIANCVLTVRDPAPGGVRWYTQLFFALWAVWNVWFYVAYQAPISTVAATMKALACVAWVGLLYKKSA